MPYSPFYRHRPYRMISHAVSPYTEIARWLMDRRGVEYREESHVPMRHLLRLRETETLPQVMVPEKVLENALQVLTYWESHSPPAEKLVGAIDPDAHKLIDRFYRTTGIAVRRWACWHLLPDRTVALRCWHQGAPFWEKVVSSLMFPVIRAIMYQRLQLTRTAPQEPLTEIDDCFQMVAQRLSDGRRYLMGNQLTAVDIVFASLIGPMILPVGYGGPLPALDDASPQMQRQILRLRDTVAGRFVIRLYQEDRGRPSIDGIEAVSGLGGRLRQLLNAVTGRPAVLRAGFRLLRKFRPVFIVGKTAVVTRHGDVTDVLKRDREFTIAPINAARMDDAHASFILGWDRSPKYDREIGILRRALGPADGAALATIVARHSREAIEAVRTAGRLDVVGGLSRVVPTRVVSEFFGTPGPNEQTMMRWMRTLFRQLFLNRSNDAQVTRAAAISADRLRDYLVTLIAERKRHLTGVGEDILTRLLEMQTAVGDSLDDDGVRRNISGLIVGAVDTTSAAVAQAVDQLLDRPNELAHACAAARADDVQTVSTYVFEALRFNPQTAGVLRFCRDGSTIGAGTQATPIPANTTVLLATLSAMFDPDAFDHPQTFRIDRDAAPYLHFGSGMHTCFGQFLNRVQIPHIVMALLKLDGLRRAPGFVGRAAYDGPFPDRLVVEFNA